MIRWMLRTRNDSDQAIIDQLSREEMIDIDRQMPTPGNRTIPLLGKTRRVVRLQSPTHTVIGVSDAKEHLKSKSLSMREAEIMLAAAAQTHRDIMAVQERADSRARRLVHNLKSLNAKTMQEIYFVVRQDELQQSFRNAVEYVTAQISQKPTEAATALLLVLKHQAAQKSEFLAFEKLSGNASTIKKEKHSIHKVLMNVFYLFFPDFSQQNARAHVEETKLQATFDYESIHACIYHVVENSAKYIQPRSSLTVNTTLRGQEIEVMFEMESLAIDPDEVERIFDERFSGRRAIDHRLNGSGIGLYIARRLARLNGGGLTVIAGIPRTSGSEFARNKFILSLPLV